MATIENVPSEFVNLINKYVCAFTDDYRLIFVVSTEDLYLRISVYDILYNTFRKLSTKVSLTKFFNETKDNFRSFRSPGLLVVDHQTLVVSYDPEYFFGPRENVARILLISVNFCTETFSIIQQLEYTDLYRSLLIKDGSDAALLYNIPEQEDHVFYLYYPLKLDNKQLVQTQPDPINLLAGRQHGYGSPSHERLHNNKLWCIVSAWDRSYKYQLMYFDLKQDRPTAVTVKFFEEGLNLYFIQILKSHLLFYTNEGEKELTFFDLDSERWSTIENNAMIKKYNIMESDKLSRFCDESDHFNNFLHFDHQRNMMAIDKVESRMHRIPFGKPRKLVDLARTSVVNLRLFNKTQLEKLFQNEQSYLK